MTVLIKINLSYCHSKSGISYFCSVRLLRWVFALFMVTKHLLAKVKSQRALWWTKCATSTLISGRVFLPFLL